MVKYRHNWACISPGLYDSLYQCRKCKDTHMVSPDAMSRRNIPEFGCPIDSRTSGLKDRRKNV